MDEQLRQQFDEVSIEPTDEVLAKSMELCIDYHITDAAEFVELWMAYSISALNNEEPTVPILLEFERKVLQVNREKQLSKKKAKFSAHLSAATEVDSNPLAIYGVPDTVAEADVAIGIKEHVAEEMLSAYNVYHTPKAKSALTRTPARHSDALFSPASYSPISGTPRIHKAAAGAGKVVYTFGNPKLIGTTEWTSLQPNANIHVKQLLLHDGEALNATTSKYMYDNLREKCEIAGDRVFHIGKSLCRKVFGTEADDYELSQVDVHSQDRIKTIGTICCDHDGTLDASSTLLVGSDEMRCRTVRLNFAKTTSSVALFPGQVIMVSGMNPKGDVFMVEEVLAERQLPAPTPPQTADQLSFVFAAGPFTHDDDLVYDPLNDLMTYLKTHKPDVLILLGPFLDAEHKLLSESVTLAESFESFFEKMIAGIVDVVGTTTTILFVSSQKDANAEPVYPTMPITIKQSYPNVHMLPDPSMVDLNGIVIGVTSTDIVDHLVNSELAINAGDKVKRVVNYLLHQGSFYPLNPPAEESVDSLLANRYANIVQVPNILLLPSAQKCFIRVVNGCLAINPGRLVHNNGGTFARLIVTPPAAKDENNLFNFVGCQVRKI